VSRLIGPAGLAAAILLAGCPLPQPLPDYPPGTITPPRIVVDDSVSRIASPETLVRVPANCPSPQRIVLTAQIRDANTIERIEVRWFVNYDRASSARYTWEQRDDITETDPLDPTLRHVPQYVFFPYDHDPIAGAPGAAAGGVRIVELVTSNGFFAREPYDPLTSQEPVPNRSPATDFEVQVYRWVFLNVAEGGGVTCQP
jgi:hypothetical protein